MTGDWVLGIASPEDFWIGFAMGVLVMLATVQIYSVLRYNYKRNIERRASQLFEEWKKEQEGKE